MGKATKRGRRRGRLGLRLGLGLGLGLGQRSLRRWGVLVRRGHVLRERRLLHSLERVLRLGGRVAVLLMLVLLLVLRRVRGRAHYGRDKVGIEADVLFLALEPLAQHRLRRLAWPVRLLLRRVALRVALRRVGRQFHQAVCLRGDG
jgi:hypothetical protein